MKRLENALDSEDILNGLDTSTLHLQPEDPAPGGLLPWSAASSLPVTLQHNRCDASWIAAKAPLKTFQLAEQIQAPQAGGIASRLSEIGILLPAVESWPGLSHTLLQHVLAEIQNSRGKSRGPDAALQRVVKKLYHCAEDVRRSGRPGMLLRRCRHSHIPCPELSMSWRRCAQTFNSTLKQPFSIHKRILQSI